MARPPIRVLPVEDYDLPRVVDERYPGDSISRYGSVFASEDGRLQAGFWRLEGGHTTPRHEGYEEVLVVLAGTLVIRHETGEFVVSQGEVAVFDCPVEPMELEAREAVTAVYVMRFRDGPHSEHAGVAL